MKKLLSILMLFVLVFSLTACGSKTLVATLDEDEIESKLEIKFNSDDEPKSIKLTMEFEDRENAKENYEDFEDMLEDFMDDEEDLGFKSKRSGKKIILDIEPSSELAELLLGIDDDMSIEDVEDELDYAGWDVK